MGHSTFIAVLKSRMSPFPFPEQRIVDASPSVVDRTGDETGIDVGPPAVLRKPFVGPSEDFVDTEW